MKANNSTGKRRHFAQITFNLSPFLLNRVRLGAAYDEKTVENWIIANLEAACHSVEEEGGTVWGGAKILRPNTWPDTGKFSLTGNASERMERIFRNLGTWN